MHQRSLKSANSNSKVILPIVIDSLPVFLITLVDSHFLFNIFLFDKYNNELLVVRHNIIHYRSSDININFDGSVLSIQYCKKMVLLRLEFSSHSIGLVEGYFLLRGVELQVNKTSVCVNGNEVIILPGVKDKYYNIGISIGQNNGASSILHLDGINRYNNR